MLLNINLEDLQGAKPGQQYSKNIPLALTIAFLFIYEIFTILPFTFNNVSIFSIGLNYLINIDTVLLQNSSVNEAYITINPLLPDTNFVNFTQIEAIGHYIYTYGSLWLIICSIILLLSMIAPIFLHSKH